MSSQPRILMIDDDAAVLKSVTGLLRDEGYDAVGCPNTRDAWKELERSTPAVMLLDIRMPEETGLQFLKRLPRPLPMPVVVMSGEAALREVLECLKLGATDFIEKPPSAERLLTAIQNAVRIGQLSAERDQLRRELTGPSQLIGQSHAMATLRAIIEKVARRDSNILIRGETGVGKERVARALHQASQRPGRLVSLNCAAIPATLLESELFGFEKGAFSGATQRHQGRVEQAENGTLFLDEIGEMSLDLQSKLLRVLENREIQRVGGTETLSVDARFVAATHRDLQELVEKGTFREDLYYRLNVFPIEVPPLRERLEDLTPLLQVFVSDIAGPNVALFTEPEALKELCNYSWPGNVRELRNFVERVILHSSSREIRIDAFALELLTENKRAKPPAIPHLGSKPLRDILEDYERCVLEAALKQANNNVAEAARILQTDRGNLHRRLKTHGLTNEVQVHENE